MCIRKMLPGMSGVHQRRVSGKATLLRASRDAQSISDTIFIRPPSCQHFLRLLSQIGRAFCVVSGSAHCNVLVLDTKFDSCLGGFRVIFVSLFIIIIII